jgi:hypothetical protein
MTSSPPPTRPVSSRPNRQPRSAVAGWRRSPRTPRRVFGVDSRVSARTFSTCSSVTFRGARRAEARRPVRPVGRRPTGSVACPPWRGRPPTARLPRCWSPVAHSSMMRQRSASCWALVGRAAQRRRVSRSSSARHAPGRKHQSDPVTPATGHPPRAQLPLAAIARPRPPQPRPPIAAHQATATSVRARQRPGGQRPLRQLLVPHDDHNPMLPPCPKDHPPPRQRQGQSVWVEPAEKPGTPQIELTTGPRPPVGGSPRALSRPARIGLDQGARPPGGKVGRDALGR